MTAHKVVDDHSDLQNVGSITHSQIDTFVNTTPFVIVSGAVGSIPPSARKLTAGSNITITDGGALGEIVIASTATGGGGGGSSTVTEWNETPTGDVDGVNTTFVLANSPSPSRALQLYVNGVLQRQGTGNDYVLSASSITLLWTPRSGSNILATYPYVFVGLTTSWMELPTGSIDGVNTIFEIANTPQPASSLMFFVNGLLMRQGAGDDYVLNSTFITMSYAPRSGSNVFATYPY